MTHMEPVRSADVVLPHQDTRYAWYVAVVLSLCQMVSYIDRWLINLLVGPIKADFQLTDTQMGLLLGLAFTVILVLLAIPDRKSVVSGKSVSVRVDLGGRSIIKKKKKNTPKI